MYHTSTDADTVTATDSVTDALDPSSYKATNTTTDNSYTDAVTHRGLMGRNAMGGMLGHMWCRAAQPGRVLSEYVRCV